MGPKRTSHSMEKALSLTRGGLTTTYEYSHFLVQSSSCVGGSGLYTWLLRQSTEGPFSHIRRCINITTVGLRNEWFTDDVYCEPLCGFDVPRGIIRNVRSSVRTWESDGGRISGHLFADSSVLSASKKSERNTWLNQLYTLITSVISCENRVQYGPPERRQILHSVLRDGWYKSHRSRDDPAY